MVEDQFQNSHDAWQAPTQIRSELVDALQRQIEHLQFSPLQVSLARLWGLSEDNIAPIASAELAISLLLKLTGLPGTQKVLTFQPAPQRLQDIAFLESVPLLQLPLNRNLELDCDRLLNSWQKRAKIVWLDRPQYPMSYSASLEQIEQLAQDLSKHALIVIDERDLDFTAEISCSELVKQNSNLLVLRRFRLVDGDMPDICVFTGHREWITAINSLLGIFGLDSHKSGQAAACVDDRLVGGIFDVSEKRSMHQKFVSFFSQSERVDKVYAGCSDYLLVRMHLDKYLVKGLKEAGVSMQLWPQNEALLSCVCFTKIEAHQLTLISTVFHDV